MGESLADKVRPGLNPETVAALAMAGVLVAAGLVDLYQALRHDGRNTVSGVILALSRAYPIIPFLMGVLIGHFLWPQIPGGPKTSADPAACSGMQTGSTQPSGPAVPSG